MSFYNGILNHNEYIHGQTQIIIMTFNKNAL